MRKLEIKNLHTTADDFEILKGVDLVINTGEVHAVMGPNGTGKSTLASTIMGYYKYSITAGDILLDGESIIPLTVDERSRRGIFMAMQQPYEIPGVTNADFIKAALQARMKEGEYLSLYRFIKEFDKWTGCEVLLSAAKCRGLIEARSAVPTMRSAYRYPRRNAAASLKLPTEVVMHCAIRGYPRRNAAASLKLGQAGGLLRRTAVIRGEMPRPH